LLAAAYCRGLWHLLDDERVRAMIPVAEEVADDRRKRTAALAALREVNAAKADTQAAGLAANSPVVERYAAVWALGDAAMCFTPDPGTDHYFPLVHPDQAPTESASGIMNALRDAPAEVVAAELRRQAARVRDLFNPFRPVAVDPAWLHWHDGTVLKLARLAYDERDLPGGTLRKENLAVLADALEEAGCAAAYLLGHLRGSGEHVRGCWAIDLLLGRS
jgi:hypothetical protein